MLSLPTETDEASLPCVFLLPLFSFLTRKSKREQVLEKETDVFSVVDRQSST